MSIVLKDDFLSGLIKSVFAKTEKVFEGSRGKKANANELAEHYLKNYGNSLLRFAYSYVHNYEDSEEILQDAILKVIRANPSFESPAHEKAYLMTTVANLSKNRIEYNRIRETDELMEELAAEEKRDLSFVWEAVRQLPDNYREVIHLFYEEGYKTAEIADITGRKDATIRSDLNRGRQLLKDILKGEYDFE